MPRNKGELLIWLVEWEVRVQLPVEEKVVIAMDTSRIEMKRAKHIVKLD